MAGNNSIQFVRGTSSKRASHTETSLAGQPIYETDTNRLYVGDGETSVNDLTAVEASAADIAENVKDQNNGAGIKIWIGTQAEFEDLETDEDTIYYITDIVSVLEVDEALKTLKEQLTSGAFKVGKAGAADNVTAQINGKTITSIFESNGTTAKEATHADGATNVTTNINGKAITSIFESNGTTAKEATHANSAINVTGQINGKAITSIFESNGTTVKYATDAAEALHAEEADEATTIGKYQHNIHIYDYSRQPTEEYAVFFSFIDSKPGSYEPSTITSSDIVNKPWPATGKVKTVAGSAAVFSVTIDESYIAFDTVGSFDSIDKLIAEIDNMTDTVVAL